MPAEQRERQNLNLAESTPHLCDQDKATKRPGWIPDLGWQARISLRVQRDKDATFSNLMKHINIDTLREAFNALDGTKALGVEFRLKQVLKSPVREIRMRGSVRVLSSIDLKTRDGG
jgi:hypothetical protein